MLYVMAYAPEEAREGDYPQLEDMTGAELDMVYGEGDWEFGEPVRLHIRSCDDRTTFAQHQIHDPASPQLAVAPKCSPRHVGEHRTSPRPSQECAHAA